MERLKVLWTQDASGAVVCARKGFITVIVDVIDMSTSIEALKSQGAVAAFGVSPRIHRCPVAVNPIKVIRAAIKKAKEYETEIVIVSEPRVGSEQDRIDKARVVIQEIERCNASVSAIVPNLGAEVIKLTNCNGKVVLAVTATGGIAFDAAYNVLGDQRVETATVARIMGLSGEQVINQCLDRIVNKAIFYRTGIGFVAASGNSIEDVLAARYLTARLTY